jgi:hypothetical protein
LIRWWILIGYCSMLAAGCYAIVVQHTPILPLSYVAATDLPAGRLLQPGDLLPVPAAGRYLAAEVKQGDPVRLDLAPALPTLRSAKDKITIALPVTAASVAAGDSNGGASVFLCPAPPAKDPISGPDTVLGAICPADSKTCIALIDLPVSHAAALAVAPVSVSHAKCQ